MCERERERERERAPVRGKQQGEVGEPGRKRFYLFLGQRLCSGIGHEENLWVFCLE
jgi:hypothetical protein